MERSLVFHSVAIAHARLTSLPRSRPLGHRLALQTACKARSTHTTVHTYPLFRSQGFELNSEHIKTSLGIGY